MDWHLREVERRKKVITCGTAVGAKQGRAKGNKQEAKYGNREYLNGKPVGVKRGKRGNESGNEALWKPL